MNSRRPSNPGRWRTRAGFGVLVLGIVLTLLFAASARWWVGYGTTRWLADLGDGTIYAISFEPSPWRQPPIGWWGGRNEFRDAKGTVRGWTWTWWVWGEQRNRFLETRRAYTVWPLGPLLLIGGAALFFPGYRRSRRLAHNQCGQCGYSRAGLKRGSVCPECGAGG